MMFDITDIMEDVFERIGGQAATASEVASFNRSFSLVEQDWMQLNYPTWRVRTTEVFVNGVTTSITLGDDIDDVLHVNSRVDSGSEAPMRRIHPDEYARLTTKGTTGRPAMFYLQRTEPPEIFFYPIGSPGQSHSLVITYIERPADFARYSVDSDVPNRWIRALVQCLAADMARKRQPVNEALVQRLTAEADRATALASRDDRQRAQYRIRMSGGRRR